MLLLSIPEGSVPDVFFFLPAGGSMLAETAVVFLLATAAVTIDDLRRLRRT